MAFSVFTAGRVTVHVPHFRAVKRPSPSEPVGAVGKIPIVECGEPLVDFLKECTRLVLAPPVLNYRRETQLRAGVVDRLCRAVDHLPEGMKLGILEGWRPPLIQRRMYKTTERRVRASHPGTEGVALRRIVNRFTAPMDRKVPPPHTTGGAIDLFLLDRDGRRVDMISPFEPYDFRAAPFAAVGLSDVARKNRDMLAEALTAEGITNYPSEYWHWSFGDQGWAYRGGHAHAIYGAVEPEGWKPHPADDSDEPLEFVEQA